MPSVELGSHVQLLSLSTAVSADRLEINNNKYYCDANTWDSRPSVRPLVSLPATLCAPLHPCIIDVGKLQRAPNKHINRPAAPSTVTNSLCGRHQFPNDRSFPGPAR